DVYKSLVFILQISFKLSYIKPGAQPQPYRKRMIYLLIKVNEEKLLAEPVLYCMVLSRLRHHPSLPRLRVRLSLSTRELSPGTATN
ncbi:hypothetical protein, partial [Bacteroides uniformis]|uniref:hypothetical protein n=1 Tax=Bacteroides uniformis TaxID=820 RepID=UPI00195C96B7